MRDLIVTKFGGTSMASVESIAQVKSILLADERRRACVVSAPGTTQNYSRKVTDLLMDGRAEFIDIVVSRFRVLMDELNVQSTHLDHISPNLYGCTYEDRVAFGEYMSAYILAQVLGWKLVDARKVFIFKEDGLLDLSQPIPWSMNDKVVVPGFYGTDHQNRTLLFPRGGSDISGAYLASMLNASCYENWTDVAGIFDQDPRVSNIARSYKSLSYDEAQTFLRYQPQVLHPDCVSALSDRNIPIYVRSTFTPDLPGTCIGAEQNLCEV